MSSQPKSRIDKFLREWSKDNIFSFRKGDAVAYLAFYIIIPVMITAISISHFPANDIAAVYCYVTILVSVLNSTYDAGNRWISGRRCRNNTKLFIMMLSCVFVAIYALVVIFGVLIAEKVYRFDWLLLCYVPVILIAIFDIAGCFIVDMVLKEYVATGE